MKTKLLFLLFFAPLVLFGQITIAEAETKSAMKFINGTRNPNTGDYDLKYHRLEFNVDPNVAFISGDVTSYFEAKEKITEITFELAVNLVVSQVLQRGNPLTFVQNNDDEVVITLPQPQNQGVLDSLTISYSGNPINTGLGSFEQSTHDGDPIIWTLSEPYGAKGWWPCKQDLIDKIDIIDVYITTPQFNPSNEEYFAVSNGMEQSQEINGNTKTTHFRHQYPIPAYLVAIAVTNYEIYSHVVPNNGNPFDIINYVFPEDLSYAQANTPITVDFINLFTDLFEEYPYADEKYGHAQYGWGGGMEHTTVSFMGDFNMDLIAHELAHQWFGNKVTCGSWQDIWINEGFASYCEGLVVEAFDGETSFRNWRAGFIDIATTNPGGSVYVPAEDTTNVGRVFNNSLTYKKPAMVLHMLRRKLGDTDFFTGLQNFLSNPNFAFGYAKTEDFIEVMETTSGEDLTEFFNDWIYDQGHPLYLIEWNKTETYDINVVINQNQSYPSGVFFEATVPLRLFGAGGVVLDVELDNTVDGQEFLVQPGFDVGAVAFDPDYHLISRYSEVVLGIGDNSPLNFSICPNPTSGILNIQSDTPISQIEVYNLLGQLVVSNNNKKVIDISNVSQGIYFIKIMDEKGTIGTQKVLKK